MRALLFERSLPRFAAARVASGWRSGSGAWVGPLRLADVDEPRLPGPDWERVRPRLSGICGSDLSTIDGRSSRYFEPIVSFPFVPGHEVVGDREGGGRVVLEPVLRCVARGIDPPCPACARGETNRCRNLAFGHLKPGLQTGFCAETGGGWGAELVAHRSQLHPVPDGLSDEAAVMVEPAACATHGALYGGAGRAGALSWAGAGGVSDVSGDSVPGGQGHDTAVVLGAGTLGLCTLAAIRRWRPDIDDVVVVAKHPEQRRLAHQLGECRVVVPAELSRAVRRRTGSLVLDSGQLTGGASLVFDCVGTSESLASALDVVQPGGTIVMLGMPGEVKVDLTGLWLREVSITGAYAYGTEHGLPGAPVRPSEPVDPAAPSPSASLGAAQASRSRRFPSESPGAAQASRSRRSPKQTPVEPEPRRTFDLAFELVADAGLERLVTAAYPLTRYREAIEHAAQAGRRGATKVAFDLRSTKTRRPESRS